MYRVEGQSYIKNGNNYEWQSNERLFRDGDGVAANSNPRQGGGVEVRYKAPYRDGQGRQVGEGSVTLNTQGDMLFLNVGQGGRADAYLAQRILQYRDAVAKMGRRASHLTHSMKIKTFKIMTRAAEDLQRRSILEKEKKKTPGLYQGVLRVDIDKAPGQFGCVRRVYTPLLRNAVSGSYADYTPWFNHLPSSILRLITKDQVRYGCVREIVVQAGNPAFLLASLPENAAASWRYPNNADLVVNAVPLRLLSKSGIESAQAHDIPVVGLRQSRHARCTRQNDTETDHGQHFEYLALHTNGTYAWYPSMLVADDLKEGYEGMSLAGAKQVAEVLKTDSPDGTWRVRRLDGSEETVASERVFWAEEQEGESVPLHEEEIDAILHHGHYGPEPELEGVLAEGYKAMSKFQVGGNQGFNGGNNNYDDEDNSYSGNNNYTGGNTGGYTGGYNGGNDDDDNNNSYNNNGNNYSGGYNGGYNNGGNDDDDYNGNSYNNNSYNNNNNYGGGYGGGNNDDYYNGNSNYNRGNNGGRNYGDDYY